MKKISTFFLFVSIAASVSAQDNRQERVNSIDQPKTVAAKPHVVTKTTTDKPTTISVRAGESQVTHNNAYYQNEISKIDTQLEAINTKVEFVQGNSEEKAIALQSGWFDDMENIKIQLENKKQELQSLLN